VKQAISAANGKDVRVGGGVATVRQLLSASRIDDMHLALRPVLLGGGEPLFQGLDMHALGYRCDKVIPGERATHMFLRRA
jgi:dihydrofolate reductase